MTHPNYLFMLKNYFRLLLCTQSYISHSSQQKIFNGYRQSLSDVSSVFLFYNSYCNTVNSVEIYINKHTDIYE